MAFYGYSGDVGDFRVTPYDDYSCPSWPSSSYSFENSPAIYNHGYVSSAGQPETNYSIYSYIEPRVIRYEPPSYSRAVTYFASGTSYLTSCSTLESKSELEFNEPEFDEYDLTPYGGGYDIALTFGEPLPPSKEICYPRSSPSPDGPSLDDFSYGSVLLPDGKDDHSSKEGGDVQEIGSEMALNGDGGSRDQLSDEDEIPRCDREGGFEKGMAGGFEVPYGSGLEAMDICEGIFGYWPCWEKEQRRNNSNLEESQVNPWKSTADYIFGSPFGFDDYRKLGS